jgi:subtilisin family serine protease
MDDFIILRDRNAGRRLRPGIPESFGAGPRTLERDAAAPPIPEIAVERMGASDVREMRRDPSVLGIARSMPTRLIAPRGEGSATASGTPTWGVRAVGADTSPFDGAGVRVAVLDTGIDADHAAFRGVTLTQRDFTGEGDGDENGHGTHCAGTIFGRDVDGTRIGVAPGVTDALIGKVLGEGGGGSSQMLFDAMFWAASQGAQVISMSLGFDFPGLGKRLVDQGFPADLATSVALEGYRQNIRVFDALLDLFRAQAAMTGGAVVVAASGNESHRERDPDHEVSASLPAAAFGVVSVGALSDGADGLAVAPFSNTNPVLSAPGVDVLSARPGGGLIALNGTSMACPHVAGVTALWWQALHARNLPVTADVVVARLRAAARTDAFAPDTDLADRGEGLAIAPA